MSELAPVAERSGSALPSRAAEFSGTDREYKGGIYV